MKTSRNDKILIDIDNTLVIINNKWLLKKMAEEHEKIGDNTVNKKLFPAEHGVSIYDVDTKCMSEKAAAVYELMNSGIEVHIVSSRLPLKAMMWYTQNQLAKQNMPYDKLVIGCKNKADYAEANGIKLIVEDSVNACKLHINKSETNHSYLFNNNTPIQNRQMSKLINFSDIVNFANVYFDKMSDINR